jgi:hypothetical protein
MHFLRFDLGKLRKGRMVQITMTGVAANIRLLNNENMYNYEHGHEYSCTGDLVRTALTEMRIPRDDHWFIVIDMEGIMGAEGRIDASVKVL